MKISQLIEALELLKKSEGDLPCVAYDGADPPDFFEVSQLEIIDMFFDLNINLKKEKAVHLR